MATIPLPADNSNYYYYYPYGFSIDSSGNFWLPQPNSGNIIELDPSYNEIASYSTGGHYARKRVNRRGWQRLLLGRTCPVEAVYQLNPTNGAVNYFAYTASDFGTLTNSRPRRRRHLGRGLLSGWSPLSTTAAA